MVSDPNDQNANASAAGNGASAAFAGFSAQAKPGDAPEEESTAETSRKSYLREFSDMCKKLTASMRDRFFTKSIATDPSALGQNPYQAFWFRKGLGDQVYDCGNRIHLSGTTKEPVTKRQIERMIEAAVNRKDPPWETIYMWDRKGNADPAMGGQVQAVINEMRAAGKIPPDCPIHAATQYPCANIKDFNTFLTSLFNAASQSDDEPAAQANNRPGFRAAPV